MFLSFSLCLMVCINVTVPNEPKRVQVQAVNSTTIYVEWRPPRAKERNGIIRGYYVYYAQLDEAENEPIKGTEKMEDTNDGNKNEIVITGLNPDTRYQVTVAGYTRRGDGVRSRPRTINTMGAGRYSFRSDTHVLHYTTPSLHYIAARRWNQTLTSHINFIFLLFIGSCCVCKYI